MGKAWYNFFVVTEEGQDALRAKQPPAEAAPVRAGDLVPESPEPAMPARVDNASELDEIYASAQIASATHGYTVLKVADMLQSEHIRALPPEVKRKSILVALDAAGVSVNDIVEDAVRRDRALDTYERVLQRNLDQLKSEKQKENAALEEEIARKLGELRARIDQNNQAVSQALQSLAAWQSRKRTEEQRIADAVSYFVAENPITTAPSEDGGGANHVR